MMFWKFLITTSILVLSTSVNAALINNGSYTTDDISGLDWLDLNLTTSMTYNDALTANPEWRHATNAEVENLFGTLFPGYYNTDTNLNFSSSQNGEAYFNQDSDVNYFEDLFGPTYSESGFSFTSGLYLDEDNNLRLAGTSRSIAEGWTVVNGTEYSVDANRFISSDTHYGFGSYMVRTTIVPVPAAIWLFGSGLIALVAFTRNRKTKFL